MAPTQGDWTSVGQNRLTLRFQPSTFLMEEHPSRLRLPHNSPPLTVSLHIQPFRLEQLPLELQIHIWSYVVEDAIDGSDLDNMDAYHEDTIFYGHLSCPDWPPARAIAKINNDDPERVQVSFILEDLCFPSRAPVFNSMKTCRLSRILVVRRWKRLLEDCESGCENDNPDRREKVVEILQELVDKAQELSPLQKLEEILEETIFGRSKLFMWRHPGS